MPEPLSGITGRGEANFPAPGRMRLSQQLSAHRQSREHAGAKIMEGDDAAVTLWRVMSFRHVACFAQRENTEV